MPYLCRYVVSLLFLLIASLPAHAFENVKFKSSMPTGTPEPVDIAIDRDGEIFVVDGKEGQIIVFDSKGHLKSRFGESGKDDGEMRSPCSIAISPEGDVVVADTGNDRIVVFKQDGTFKKNFGEAGSKPGQLNDPVAVAIDKFGFVYVAEEGTKRVQVFSSRGIFLWAIQLPEKPKDIVLDPARNVYVLVPKVGKVLIFDSKGKQSGSIACTANGDDFGKDAMGLAVDKRGDIYISEDEDQSVKKFDKTGRLLISFGSEGEGRGQFDDPAGLACTDNDTVFVVDTGNERVQSFNISGSSKKEMTPVTVSPPMIVFEKEIVSGEDISALFVTPDKKLYAVNSKEGQIHLRGSSASLTWGDSGNDPGEFRKPQGVAVSKSGNVYVADTGNNRIQLLNPDGSFNYKFGKKGDKTGQFDDPSDVAVNSKGLIYVADTDNHRVEIFNPDTMFLASFGLETEDSKNPEGGSFDKPTDLAIDSADNVYVLDFKNNRVQLFDSDGNFKRVIGGPGEGLGQFDEPLSIATDEKDYLYVADSKNSRIQIFDGDGNLVVAFGSPGEGTGRFKKLSAVAASKGRVYVADEDSEKIQVFSFYPKGIVKKDRTYATSMAYPVPGMNGDAGKKATTQNAKQMAIKDLAAKYKVSPMHMSKYIEVEDEEVFPDGRVKVTISAPKKIPAEKRVAPKPRKVKKAPKYQLQ
ncbi:NHL repeat-containing protein [Desulfovibrio sp. JC010]|uniref:NHL repeat-containing protein n=1 Tax=Desulfovibrio sp. JC010 TaxID=2593641 RepID=UPI0013D855C9|nr:NHL repeat-containing protein [Desulfovibrio sp. JC010]